MEEERGLGEIEKREIERKKIYREKEIEIVSYQSDHLIYLAVKSQDVVSILVFYSLARWLVLQRKR